MEIWLDTTNLDTIKEARAMGILHGITTNPTIVSNSGISFEKLIISLLDAQDGPVAAQVVADDASEMIQHGKKIFSISPRMLIKVPATSEGYKCMNALTQAQISVLATAIYEPKQALLSFKAGAQYLAPYIGRIKDSGIDPRDVLEDILEIKGRFDYPGKLMGAGIRELDEMMYCSLAGVCAVTITDVIFHELMTDHQGVKNSLEQFFLDWLVVKW
jgi:transaldolase